MKIGLVTPYIFPLPGGVNAHVGQLYEQLRGRGHDVRIISSTHGLQRSSEGDIIRIGRGFSIPSNGSVGTLTVSPRFLSQVRDVLRHEQFDLLHLHEPFVPFLSPVVLREFDERQRRHVPRLWRLQPRVRVCAAHARRVRTPAPRPDRGQRRGPPLHLPLLRG